MEISGKTRLFGLIGSPVEHSKSPAMYNYCFDKWKLDYKYLAFDVDKNQTEDAIQAFRTFQMKGANITMPCKQEVLKYLDEISPAARLVGRMQHHCEPRRCSDRLHHRRRGLH